MSEDLKSTAPATLNATLARKPQIRGYNYQPLIPERLNAANSIELKEDGSIGETTPISDSELIQDSDKPTLVDNAGVDVPAVKASNLNGGRKSTQVDRLHPSGDGCRVCHTAGILQGYRRLSSYYARRSTWEK